MVSWARCTQARQMQTATSLQLPSSPRRPSHALPRLHLGTITAITCKALTTEALLWSLEGDGDGGGGHGTHVEW